MKIRDLLHTSAAPFIGEQLGGQGRQAGQITVTENRTTIF